MCVCVCVCVCVCYLLSPATEKRATVDLEQQVNQFNKKLRGFPVGSVVRSRLPMQETQIIPDAGRSTYYGATKPVYAATDLGNLCSRAWKPHLLSLPTLEPVLHKRSHCNKEQPPLSTTREKLAQQRRPAQPKTNKK